jgi:holo-[acyl-carrier protein] synthase
MQILGVGVDIIENSRMKKSIKNKKFLSRFFSKREIVNSINIIYKSNYFSKRFAAKEAFSKAVGSGFRNGLNFNDISVVKDRYGKPSIKLNTQLKNIIKKKFKTLKVDVFLFIFDEKKHSIAFVILEKK